MRTFGKTVSTAIFTGALVATLFGCQKQEGPVEEAGKAVDESVEKAGQQIEKAGDKIEDAAKDEKK